MGRSSTIRVTHYINQFFAGIGGEEAAEAPLEFRDGPVGPGLALQSAFGDEATVIGTIVCGDNYFHDHTDEVVAAILSRLEDTDLFVAGPGFNAGRYGLASAMVCDAVTERLGVPAVTGLYPEAPAVETHHRRVVIVPTGETARSMVPAVQKMAEIGLKLAKGEPLGPAAEEGIIPRGLRDNHPTDVPAARRAVDLLLGKLRGERFESEIPILEPREPIPPAPAPEDLAHATVALVTEGGLVPRGNPDQIESSNATKWARYPIADLEARKQEFHSIHGGYDSRWVDEDPYRIVPVDAARALERDGAIGKLHEYVYVTVGTGMSLADAERIGGEIAEVLINEGVQAVVLTST